MSDFTNAAFQLGLTISDDTSQEEAPDKKIKILKIVVLVLGILLAIEGVLYTLVMPCLSPAKMEYNGLRTLSVQEVNATLKESGGETWISFDTAKAVSALSTMSCIETVSVYKHFPDKVRVSVKERDAVAKTIVNFSDHQQSIQIDRNGVLFTAGSQVKGQDFTVPLISGLPLENVQDGMRLPAKYRPLMEQIAYLRTLPQKYFAAISEIQVLPKAYGNYELVLYPIHTKVKVLTDRALDEEQLKYMMVALDVVNSIDSNVGVIDLRYGSVSYRAR